MLHVEVYFTITPTVRFSDQLFSALTVGLV